MGRTERDHVRLHRETNLRHGPYDNPDHVLGTVDGPVGRDGFNFTIGVYRSLVKPPRVPALGELPLFKLSLGCVPHVAISP